MNANPHTTAITVRPFSMWPYVGEEEQAAALGVLRSGKVNYWTGDEGRQFETEFARFAGCNHAVALSNGTVALELALYAAGIGPGDEVIVPPRTYVATASSVAWCGATPVFAEVDPVSQNITAETIRAVLSPRTKAIIVVHLTGWPCDMDPIMDLAQEHDLIVIEDAAQAHGATYKEQPVGSLGHLATFSFCQDKIMTTGGEGGMVTTSDEALWKRVWALKDHGKSYDAVHQRAPGPGFRWLHEAFGTNARMTEMQAAMGRVVLRKLPGWVETRRHHAALLDEGFASIPALRVTVPPPEIGHAYYKYYAFVEPEHLRPGWNRERIAAAISERGVPCFSGICGEVYLEEAFIQAGLQPAARLPVARRLGETSLMFLVHPTLTDENMYDTCRVVEAVMREAVTTSAHPAETRDKLTAKG